MDAPLQCNVLFTKQSLTLDDVIDMLRASSCLKEPPIMNVRVTAAVDCCDDIISVPEEYENCISIGRLSPHTKSPDGIFRTCCAWNELAWPRVALVSCYWASALGNI